MKCPEIQDLLSPYLDGELSAHEAKQVNRHLETCPVCVRELAGLRSTVELCRSLEVVEVPAGFHENTMNLVRNRVLKQSREDSRGGVLKTLMGKAGFFGTIRSALDKASYRGLAAVAATLVVLFAAGFFWNFFGGFGVGSPQLASKSGPAADEMVLEEKAAGVAEFGAVGGTTGIGAEALSGTTPELEMPGNIKFPQEGSEAVKSTSQGPRGRADGETPSASMLTRIAPQQFVDTGSYERKVIKNADLVIEVPDIQKAYDEIVTMVRQSNGYVQDGELWQGDDGGRQGARLLVRVPSGSFEDLVTKLGGLGKVKVERIYSNDITGQYYDAEARLRNFERQEQRYLELLDRADRISDIIAVERELERLRGQIEMLIAQIRAWDSAVGLSTIRVELRVEGAGSTGPPGIFAQAVLAFMETLKDMVDLAGWVVIFVGRVGPVAVLAGLVWLVYRRLVRRGQDKGV